MGYLVELLFHVDFTVTVALMRLRSISVDTIPTTSLTYLRTPPPPAGPLVYSASTSSPINAASAAVAALPATRNRTSYGALFIPNERGCTEVQPIKSIRRSEN